MTKNVRIENADNSKYKVVVETWEVRDGAYQLVDTKVLNNPTDMLNIAIWTNRYLVIKETND